MTNATICDECESVEEHDAMSGSLVQIQKSGDDWFASVDLCTDCSEEYGLGSLLEQNKEHYDD